MKRKKDKHSIAHWFFLFIILIILILGYFDSIQIKSWHEVNDDNKWSKYEQYNAPAFMFLWFFIFIILGIVYFVFRRDITESLALITSGYIMIMFGLLDVGFFWFSSFKMSSNMCWFNDVGHVIAKVTSFLGHECVTAFDLYLSTAIGIVIAFIVFKLLLLIEFDDIIMKKLKR